MPDLCVSLSVGLCMFVFVRLSLEVLFAPAGSDETHCGWSVSCERTDRRCRIQLSVANNHADVHTD